VRAGHAKVRVVHKDGSGGGGAFTWPWLLALLSLVAARVANPQPKPAIVS
jgi:hypothetical protein